MLHTSEKMNSERRNQMGFEKASPFYFRYKKQADEESLNDTQKLGIRLDLLINNDLTSE